jgi:hypothetical protein
MKVILIHKNNILKINDRREDLEDEDTALAFLYVSDDMEWGRKNIKSKGHKDIFFVGKLELGAIQ